MTVTIYKVTCFHGFSIHDVGEGYSLKPWRGDDWDYLGKDDGGQEYELPEGYEVSEFGFEELGIFKGEMHYDLVVHGRSPALIGSDATHPIPLKKARHDVRKNQLVYYRTKNGYTQQGLADKSGVNIRQIQRYESETSDLENMTIKNALAIAHVLGIDPEELL